ncbi:MAG: hypothetical protein N2053_00860 [Chitinispirillaceae bacterium]|nr:hypothetical protein [Chitinispirillaceae bacterium]
MVRKVKIRLFDRLVLIVCVIGFLIGCMQSKPTNPLDREPEIKIYAPSLDTTDTLNSDTLSFSLSGNSEYSLFRFRLDKGMWSQFTEGGTFKLDMLDEGEHVLEIESKYEGHSKISSKTIVFYVNSFDSTAVYLTPQLIVRPKSVDTATVSVSVKGLDACDRIHFSFTGVLVDSVYLPREQSYDSLILFSSGGVIDLLARPGVLPFREDVTALKIRIKTEKKIDSTKVVFSCIARDTANVDIKIKNIRGSLIIKE